MSLCNIRKNICTNNNGQKIYRWMPVRFTRHQPLLNNPTILNTKTFYAPSCHTRKLYRCMTARSTRHHTFLHNTLILHTMTFFAPAYHPHNIYRCMIAHSTRHHTLLQNTMILHTKKFSWKPVTRSRKYRPLQNMVKNSNNNISRFSSLGLRLCLYDPLSHNW